MHLTLAKYFSVFGIVTCQATNRDLIRFKVMTRPTPRSASTASLPAYQVEAPRASDAIGLALRDAYERDLGLPEDMAAMLRSLNGSSGASAH
jgi:hypothetical protein